MHASANEFDILKKSFSGMAGALVGSLARLEGGADDAVLLAAALASQAAAEGHVCIDLSRLAAAEIGSGDGTAQDPACPPLSAWLPKLEASPLVGGPGAWRPLILDRRHFLYLRRFHRDEQMIAAHLFRRGRASVALAVKKAWLELLRRYFPAVQPGETDWQAAAAVIALMRRLCIISGAPGTGKTTTAARIIALLIAVYDHQPLQFALCAPTGKAAARLGDALRAAAVDLPGIQADRHHFPTEAATIHRLLGYRRNRFVFNADNPLPADVVVVDEASMIDLALMARLLEAVPANARLIILGDHHQLSSVEAGAVMGDICQGAARNGTATDIQSVLQNLKPEQALENESVAHLAPPLSDNVVVLERNYRFDDKAGIGGLVKAINEGHLKKIKSLLGTSGSEIQWIQAPSGAGERQRLQGVVVDGYRPVFEARSAEEALVALEGFMVLGALTGGPWGTDRLNQWIESLGRREGWFEAGNAWYPGRPVMIRRNDYRTGLFNGDVGVVWHEHVQGETQPRIWFRSPEGPLRSFAPPQLPEHQTAFALTVHKSQGSEYRRVVLTLPEKDNPVLSRELLYTGLSRAREQIWLVADESVLDLTVNRRIDRTSGLKFALERQAREAGKVEAQQDGREGLKR